MYRPILFGLQPSRAALLLPGVWSFGSSTASSWPTTIFAPNSTPADSIFALSLLIIAIVAFIFVVVFSLIAYAVVRFRARKADENREPPQVYGSNQIELAWTVIPTLIVLVLFLASGRVIGGIQDAEKPSDAINITVVGHQFWWEFRYSGLNVVTANEMHVPVSDPAHSTPTYLTLLSADTDHSFWVPRLAGKTDLIPNHPNTMWIDPHQQGLYLGQCAQYCGVEHAKMLLRVYVQPRADFDGWIRQQQQSANLSGSISRGHAVFETFPCLDCHAVRGMAGNGHFGPDLTHLMSRDTIASGAALNTRENLRKWVGDPNSIKPGVTMPNLHLSDQQVQDVVAFLETLH
ncbi:MAG: cytochrome c oxidase subunit II [Terracidiphilus sp.]